MKWIKKIKILFNHKVLFCDLDGTLIETKSGNTFPINENDWKFKYGIKKAIQEYNPKYIFIISNQGGIEKGFVNENKFIAKMAAIVNEIKTWGNFVVDYIYCTSNDKNNPYRKPNDGMVHDFIYNAGYSLSKKQSLMIGDASGLDGQFSGSDLQCAKNAGIRYTDVNYFIESMCPCAKCFFGNIPCKAGEQYPNLPCNDSKKTRLKKVLLYKP